MTPRGSHTAAGSDHKSSEGTRLTRDQGHDAPNARGDGGQPASDSPGPSHEDIARLKRDEAGSQTADQKEALEIAADAQEDGMIGITIKVPKGLEHVSAVSPARAVADEDEANRDQKGQGSGADPSPEYSLLSGGVLPPMSIVIFIVGSRGDVQPYLSLAIALIIQGGHRVRLATHPDFRNFVLDANSRLRGKAHRGVRLEGRLEFFDAGGNPKELMAYMVKNPGLLPGTQSLTNGDIKRKQTMVEEYLRGFYRSTFSPDPVSGREFAADAIISNPPAFAHIHVAEALGIPLLMSFTMPWTATTSFPHPLVNVTKSNASQAVTNWMGYHLADILMWEGLGSKINKFRTSILRLNAIDNTVAAGVLDNIEAPWTYCWSPELLPKPRDWSSNIDISGFYFLDGEDDFAPPAKLGKFLDSGKPPIYIGFGSVVIQDPERMTDIIFEAVRSSGVRAILSAGWAGLGKEREGSDPDIFILSEDCPHEWLFANNRVAAVCHHGGAGTTACGLRHGRPTIIVPFFGDQTFWGGAVHNAGAGPAPIPIKEVSVQRLTDAFVLAGSQQVIVAATELGRRIRAEPGEEKGVKSFERHMPVQTLRCDVDPEKVAVWWCKRFCLRLSVEAAGALIARKQIVFSDLEPHRSKEYDTNQHSRDFLTAPLVGMGQAFADMIGAAGQLFYDPVKGSVKLFYGVPESLVGVLADMYDGFQNIPRLMGSTQRPKTKVTDWKTGMSEGGKAISFGLWDGITGLVTEPTDGYRREGAVGLGKGVGRGMANAVTKPLGGYLGLFVHPARGIRESVRSAVGQNLDPHSVYRGPREALTKESMSSLTAAYADHIVQAFAVLEAQTGQRREQKKKFKWFVLASKEEVRQEKLDRERKRAG